MRYTLLIAALAVACRSDKGSPAEETPDTGGAPLDADGDGYAAGEDCDDAEGAINPGVAEICDGIDNDCDGAADEDVTDAFYADSDGDGFGETDASTQACEAPAGYAAVGGDCDDADGESYPGAAEACDEADNDCDGSVDEDVTTAWYADADGDSYGDPGAGIASCAPEPGYVADNSDCDDTDAGSFPGGDEVCDEADNDCDGDVDEGVQSTFYPDIDGDGFGIEGGPTQGCDLPTGYARQAGDCDDDAAAVSPLAAELCDGIDNDCDGEEDEDSAADAATFYADGDGDGYGDAGDATDACDAPAGYTADDADCDDAEPAVNPGEAEICDDLDNDCDGEADESAADAPTWHQDSDGDGYAGDRFTVTACDAPASYYAAPDDCDDLDPGSHPGGSEVCDGADNDCDGEADEGASDAEPFYADSDGDGYGDPGEALAGCGAAAGYVEDDTDCDDAEPGINPGEDEVCDDLDNDCDGEADEGALDAEVFYADADGDGYGDPGEALESCEQPASYVENGEDCDDGDPGDADGDGLQDCEDGDIDGDGLRNEWDADERDASVARGPTGGLGGDGARTVAGTEVFGDWTLLDGAASAGSATLIVEDGSLFLPGDEVLVLSQQGADAGTWQAVFVAAAAGDALTVEPPLDRGFSGSSVVLVQRIPHYTTLTVPAGAALAADDWAGAGGGVIFLRAQGAIAVAGSISAYAAGFRGGDGVYGNDYDPGQGESYGGPGAAGVTSANGGGGGAYPRRPDNGDSGGGGGYGSAGDAGTSYDGSSVCAGGSAYGDSALLGIFLGSGGGGGSPDAEGDGDPTSNYAGAGGDGGGLIGLFSASSLTITGAVSASGEDGDDADPTEGEVGGGGGGSGGAIYLAAPTVTLSGSVTAQGGAGGSSGWHDGLPYGSAYGGDGGAGRVRIDADASSGSTAPAAGYAAGYEG